MGRGAQDRHRHVPLPIASLSRANDNSRRLMPALAWSSSAWFLDEPDVVLRLELPVRGDGG